MSSSISLRNHVSGASRFLKLIARHGKPDRLFYFVGGLGDQLLCTALARELQQRRRRKIWMFSNALPLFEGNPDFQLILTFDIWLIPWMRLIGVPATHLFYQDLISDEGRDAPATEHSIASLCRKMGVTGQVTLRPYLHDIQTRQGVVRRDRPRVVVQSGCLTAKYPILNKQWPADRMQAVVDALKDRVDFIQLGDPGDPPLEGAQDFRGKTSIRETISILADASLFLGLVGFLMHLSRAVECPAVIVYGGREWPEYTGYSCNINLVGKPPCAPCWYYSRCDFERRCLTEITVEDVTAAVEKALANPPERPLKADTCEIS